MIERVNMRDQNIKKVLESIFTVIPTRENYRENYKDLLKGDLEEYGLCEKYEDLSDADALKEFESLYSLLDKQEKFAIIVLRYNDVKSVEVESSYNNAVLRGGLILKELIELNQEVECWDEVDKILSESGTGYDIQISAIQE
jgi:hypothetical protein